ncbi:hypothetical protein AOXY_G7997 [Acipenser oxyrinchus oxyrinchus]|uniref:DASH complex subunit DAD2 n=1 Tax=Acipenser oxyrinchus oxyrinchus TaxID=40147 RepID=A0AAD8GAY5_ACIOX|nr:hypothetical protein AOXY_G7997 [Acipenser oxyrinchus oxyrinchus]
MSNFKKRQSGTTTSALADGELQLLQQELQALQQIRSSLKAVKQMVGCLNQNLQLSIKNSHNLAELNQGWKIFFTGQK